MASLCAYNYTQCYELRRTELTHSHTRAENRGRKVRARCDLMSNILSRARCMHAVNSRNITIMLFCAHCANKYIHVHYNWLTVIILMDNQPSRLTHAAAE
jgi:hypothetical protein